MDFSAVALTEDQQAFAEEVRAFLDEHLTPEVYAGMRERADNYDEELLPGHGRQGLAVAAVAEGRRRRGTGRRVRQDPRNRAARTGRADRHARHDQPGVAGGRGVTGTRGCATS